MRRITVAGKCRSLQSGSIGLNGWKRTEGGDTIGNYHNTKANRTVRKFLDTFFQDKVADGGEVTTGYICTLVNGGDRRRGYNETRIGTLLRERDDLEKTATGWRKKHGTTN